MQRVNENLKNKNRVCAIKYKNKEKDMYDQKSF
jgi:hypothetical protein